MFLLSLPWRLNLRTCNTTTTYIKEKLKTIAMETKKLQRSYKRFHVRI